MDKAPPHLVSQVQVAYERYNMTAPSDRPESVQIPASAFAYSAMPDHLNDAQVNELSS